MPDTKSIEYINSSDYKSLELKLKTLKEILDDQINKTETSRKLRYAEVDIEAEREAGRFQPDELYVPLHIIDTNIRREQSPYVQYITQSPRAVILEDLDDSTFDLQVLEKDLTKKLRFPGWQLPMFANIDGFQSHGFGIMEVIQDQSAPGEVSFEFVQYCDFGFIADTRNIQAVEMTARAYYYTRTKLLSLCGDGTQEGDWVRAEVDKLLDSEPDESESIEASDIRDRSLFKVIKYMFKVDGVVNVGWARPDKCSGWLRNPRPLFIGRRQPRQLGMLESLKAQVTRPQFPPSEDSYESEYPYVLFPYLISENDTISQLKGRIFLDQDLQEAASSLLASICTKARRSAGLYFSRDTSDPNDDVLMQKNIYFKQGALINAKVQAFELAAPDPGLFSAIQMLMVANQNETSQVSFAVQNRKDSRKTAKEVEVAEKQEQTLSTVQVVLFSIALTQLYRKMSDIIKSRVVTGLINVPQNILALYQRRFTVKPSGDTDVIEKQQLIQKMMNSWPVVQNTPIATMFLLDLLSLMFPDRIDKYRTVFEQAQQQQQSAQAQQMQMILNTAKEMADGIVELSKHPDFFSDAGKLHALPQVQMAADKLEKIMKGMNNGQGNS